MTPEEKVKNLEMRLRISEGVADTLRAQRNDAVREALTAGMSLRKVATLAGISHQRVAKIAQG